MKKNHDGSALLSNVSGKKLNLYTAMFVYMREKMICKGDKMLRFGEDGI